MRYDDSFAWVNMPRSRLADSYLSYADDSVFIDFVHINTTVQIIRISFDGYGCCNLDRDSIVPMNSEDSSEFLRMYDTGVIQQSMMKKIIIKTISDNQYLIWNDALKEYKLLSNI